MCFQMESQNLHKLYIAREFSAVVLIVDIASKRRPQMQRESASLHPAFLATEESAILFFTQTIPISAQDVLFRLILICPP